MQISFTGDGTTASGMLSELPHLALQRITKSPLPSSLLTKQLSVTRPVHLRFAVFFLDLLRVLHCAHQFVQAHLVHLIAGEWSPLRWPLTPCRYCQGRDRFTTK
jgi:hypothetical protein